MSRPPIEINDPAELPSQERSRRADTIKTRLSARRIEKRIYELSKKGSVNKYRKARETQRNALKELLKTNRLSAHELKYFNSIASPKGGQDPYGKKKNLKDIKVNINSIACRIKNELQRRQGIKEAFYITWDCHPPPKNECSPIPTKTKGSLQDESFMMYELHKGSLTINSIPVKVNRLSMIVNCALERFKITTKDLEKLLGKV